MSVIEDTSQLAMNNDFYHNFVTFGIISITLPEGLRDRAFGARGMWKSRRGGSVLGKGERIHSCSPLSITTNGEICQMSSSCYEIVFVHIVMKFEEHDGHVET